MTEYNHAIWKFNGGNGALLCNRCGVIIALGLEHEDVEHLCDECKSSPEKPFRGRIVAWKLVGLPKAHIEGIFVDRDDMGLRSGTSALVSEPGADGEIETQNSRYVLHGDEYSDETRRAAGLLIAAAPEVPVDEGFAYALSEINRRSVALFAVVAAIDKTFVKSRNLSGTSGLREALDTLVLETFAEVTTSVLCKLHAHLFRTRVHMPTEMRKDFDAIEGGMYMLLAQSNDPETAQMAATAITKSAQWAVDNNRATKPRAQATVAAWHMVAGSAVAIGETDVEGAIREEYFVYARLLTDAVERNITGSVQNWALLEGTAANRAVGGIVIMPRFGGGTSASAKEIEARYTKLIGAKLPVVRAKDLSVARAKLVAEFPHAAEQIDVLMSDLTEGEEIKFRSTLLLSEPGSGKSRLVRRLADALAIGLHRFDAANSADSSFGGTARRWSTGEHCYPFEAICRYRIANPLMQVEEIDKCGTSHHNGNLESSLMPFLEIESAKRYPDPYVLSDICLEHISYIFTANDDRRLAKPLRDRLRVLRMPMPTVEHLPALARAMVSEIATEKAGDPRWWPPLDEDELEVAARLWTAGGSVRRLREIVVRILARREKMPRN